MMRLSQLLFAFFILIFCGLSHADVYKTLTDKDYEIDFSQPNKPVVLITWASWCGYCMKEIPHLKAERVEHPDFIWLGLNVNKTPEDGRKVEVERNLPWPSLSDPDLIIGDRFDVRGTPTLIVLNASGEAVFRGRRVDDDFKDALDSLQTER
ncbi:TlpA family protein disulfide reductase [Thalassolituus maritimus]|uniref:Thioredoxin domain-containing protein n=1 Tax=Thalassolituus maritimus TaxID=484498 RepID=A0ABQ0A2P2_9GAMM